MRRILLLGAALMLSSPIMLGEATAAGPSLPQLKSVLSASASGAIVEHAGWGRCARWNNTCRWRWGWGWRYRRCMRVHGC